MNKETKKRKNYNEVFINALFDKYGFSHDYIRKCLRKDRTGLMPDKIIADYKQMESAERKIVDKLKS
jgi:hypothetical protein